MLKQDKHDGLCGSDRRSVIPYVHREDCCIVVCVIQSWRLNLPKKGLSVPVACPAFYDLGLNMWSR
jgi:hypothetical protein